MYLRACTLCNVWNHFVAIVNGKNITSLANPCLAIPKPGVLDAISSNVHMMIY